MRKTKNDRLSFSFGAVYGVLLIVVLTVTRHGHDFFQWPETTIVTAIKLATIGSLAMLHLLWVCHPAAPHDRGRIFVEFVWVYGPLYLVIAATRGTHMLDQFPLQIASFLSASPVSASVDALLNTVLWLMISILWITIRWPFAKRKILRDAQDYEASKMALERSIWPLTLEQAKDMDIQIAPRFYYSFLAGVFWIVFIVLESTLGEFLGDFFGSGYVGASIIALGIAATIYPAHKRVSKYVEKSNSAESEAGVSDYKTLLIAVRRSIRAQLMPIIPYWRVIVAAVIATLLIAYAAGYLLGYYGILHPPQQ